MIGFFAVPGIPELLIVLVIVLLLFGAKRLPEIARSLGRSSSELKKGLADGEPNDVSPGENANKSD